MIKNVQMSEFARAIMLQKYSQQLEDGPEGWGNIAYRATKHVMKAIGYTMRDKLSQDICAAITERKFLPAGRYLYATGRPRHQVCNCYLFNVHDSREGWADLLHDCSVTLMTGGGVGVNYSDIRPEGARIRGTGGTATGPIALMQMLNECGRGIMMGGSRRCLPATAPITMADGSKKPIKNVKVGDLVHTQFGPRKVLRVFDQGPQRVYRIVTDNGNLYSTRNHRWWGCTLSRTPKWITTKDIKPGWKIYRSKYPRLEPHGIDLQFSKVLKVRKAWVRDTYDLEIEGEHQFVAYEHISHNSALWAGLRWDHPDVYKLIQTKNWTKEIRKLKAKDFNFPATLDQTNISVCLNESFFKAYNHEDDPKHSFAHSVYWAAVERMLKTGEPGFSVDIGKNRLETLRNPCCEICSADNNDVCDLGSINLARVGTIEEFENLVEMAVVFLLAGTVYTDLPFPEVAIPQSKNRRLGLGLLGVHDWLLQRGRQYAPDTELWEWLQVYQKSTKFAHKWADELELSRPVKTRAIAPTGTVSILAETTGGIEPIFCVAYKRRYLKGTTWRYQYVVDPTAARLIKNGVDPELIEDAYDLDPESRIDFQAWIQQAVDHAISSTVNLPHWGSKENNSNTVRKFGNMLMKYLPHLRGITCYPDGARDGQPLTPVLYKEAVKHLGEVVEESGDICKISKGGSCSD